jgi:2-polyprenyl-6-methoxyphenol hydroxylase-like FAD-dependent oxidoreductase
MRVTVFERDASAIRGEGKYRGPIQIQSNALAALQAVDADIAKAVMAEGCITVRAPRVLRACFRAHTPRTRPRLRLPHAPAAAHARHAVRAHAPRTRPRADPPAVHPRFLRRTQGDRINGLVDGVTGDWYCKFDTFHPAVDNGLPVTRVISRVTLQSILAGGLPESAVMNNCKVSAFEDSEDCVTAVLEDGRRISGDVLIGADGARRARHRKTSVAPRVSGTDACLRPA